MDLATKVTDTGAPEKQDPPPAASCCGPKQEATCCAPEEKTDCCGTAGTTGTCGCR